MTPTPEIFDRAMAIANNPRGMMDYLFSAATEALAETDGTGILEIGTHRGGSALMFLDAIAQSGGEKFLVTVDPWGGRPYPGSKSRYFDSDQWDAMSELSAMAVKWGLRWHHFKMPSISFLKNVQDEGCWYGGEQLDYRWALAFLDGEHVVETVLSEIDLVVPRMAPGGKIVIDNANHIQPGEDRPKGQMESALQRKADELGMEAEFTQYEGDLVCELRGF